MAELKPFKRQKTRRVTKKVYEEDIKLIKGKYVRTWIVKNQEVDEPIFEEHPLYDENDINVGMHKFPVMESVDEEVIIQKERDKKFTRTHYGLSAQQVKPPWTVTVSTLTELYMMKKTTPMASEWVNLCRF